MATAKKKPNLLEDLKDMDYMDIISGGETQGIFSENKLSDYSYPTGIPIIDYMYGYEINVRDPETKEVLKKRKCLGLQAGSFNVITGRTQSFKTTIAIQMIANMAFSYGGNVVHYDAEQRLVLERVKNLSKLPESWFIGDHPRYALRCGAIGFDTLQNDIATLHENKLRNRTILEKDTGEVDSQNRPIKMMPPTIVFVDSIQDVIREEAKYDVENKNYDDMKELRGNMVGAQSAKTIRGFLTDILPMLKEANIILIVIAHKTTNMSTNAFTPPPKQFGYGSANERISGGSAIEFNASAVINLSGQSSADSRYTEEQDGFAGNTTMIEPTKSSTNESGNDRTGLGFDIIIDRRRNGVDNLRTLLKFLKAKGRLKGNNAGWRVIDKKGNELTEKFTWKHIYEDFNKNPEIYKTFMTVAKEELEKLISKSDETLEGTINPMNMDQIVSEF